MVEEISPDKAWEILQANNKALLLDVRSTLEFQYVGHPVGAVNIPLKEPPDWVNDPKFIEKVKTFILANYAEIKPEDISILSLCRSGQRSMLAAETLTAAGFSQAYNIKGGFEGDRGDNQHRGEINGWRFHKLPWEQS